MYFNLVDRPDQARKRHAKPIPPAGGFPIALSYLGAIGLAILILPEGPRLVIHHNDLFWRLLPSVALVFVAGFIDDIVGLGPKQKLVAQFVAAGWACFVGVRIYAINDHPVAEWWSIPVSIIWLVGCTNAINLIDGLDGLASGVGLFATLTAFIAAAVQHNIGLALATAPLVGSLLGFLRYNFAPASVFLGDSGSLTVGFLLGSFSLIWCEKSATILGMAAPLIALSLPLLDVFLSIGRRFLGNRPIFRADYGHIHHRLLARGFRPRDAALVLYAACGCAAVLSLLHSLLYRELGGIIVILFCGCAWIGVRALGYVEFHVAGQMLIGGGFRRILREEICLDRFRLAFVEARSIPAAWPVIRDTCRELNFCSARLVWATGQLHESFTTEQPQRVWEFQISLPDSYTLILERNSSGHESLAVISLIEILQSARQEGSRAGADSRRPAARTLIRVFDPLTQESQ